MPTRAVWAQIDLSAVEHNIKQIRGKIKKGTKLCAIIKADAYGHGAIAVAKTAVQAGAEYLAVAILNEALELRNAGFKEPILILGYTPPDQAEFVVDRGISQTVFSFEAAKILSEAAVRQNKTIKVHLKIDTGMSRIGILPEEAGRLSRRISALPHVEIEGIFSHFATSDCKDKAFAHHQLERFNAALKHVEAEGITIPLKHMANSAAILDMPEAHFDMVRAGVILYGLWPSEEVDKSVQLRPALQLKAKIAYVKKVVSGQPISYGCLFVTARESIIATLPIGYADGYTRLLTGKAQVMVRGKRVPVVGKICMDQCMLDVTDVDGVKAGDEVILFGNEEIPVDEIAGLLGTINYEIICMVGNRIPRVYI